MPSVPMFPPPPPHCYFRDYHHRPFGGPGHSFMGGMSAGSFPGATTFADFGPSGGPNCPKKAWKRYWRNLNRNAEGKKRCKKEGTCHGKERFESEAKNCSSSSSEEDKGTAPTSQEHPGGFARPPSMDWMWPLFSLDVGLEHGGKKFHCHKFGGHCQRKGGPSAPTAGQTQTEGTAEKPMEGTSEKPTEEPERMENEVPPTSFENKSNDSDWTFVREENAMDDVKQSAEGIKNIQINESGDTAVVTSLSQMHSMGFYDDGKGGSLYELMVKTDGDIESAIEVINSNKEKKN